MDVIQLFLNYICLYNMYALWYKLSIIFILKFINVIQYRDDIYGISVLTVWGCTPNNNP
jgi:hypothetical protein